jgi:hypothetical protein
MAAEHITRRRYYIGHCLAILTVWSIWKQKKDKIFKRNEKSPVDLLSEIIDEAYMGKSVEVEAFVFLVAMYTNG